MRRFEYRSAESAKFWNVDVVQGFLSGSVEVRVQFGRIGTDGQAVATAFNSFAAAKDYERKKIAEKLAKGYVERREDGSSVVVEDVAVLTSDEIQRMEDVRLLEMTVERFEDAPIVKIMEIGGPRVLTEMRSIKQALTNNIRFCLTPKQRGYVEAIAERLGVLDDLRDEEARKRPVPRGREVPTPEVLRDLPKAPPGRPKSDLAARISAMDFDVEEPGDPPRRR